MSAPIVRPNSREMENGLREPHEEKPERVEREYRKGAHGETLAFYRYVLSVYGMRAATIS